MAKVQVKKERLNDFKRKTFIGKASVFLPWPMNSASEDSDKIGSLDSEKQ